MPELKVICGCGQKYKFDVEPVGGRMPYVVNCPVCGVDGTGFANTLLAEMPVGKCHLRANASAHDRSATASSSRPGRLVH